MNKKIVPRLSVKYEQDQNKSTNIEIYRLEALATLTRNTIKYDIHFL